MCSLFYLGFVTQEPVPKVLGIRREWRKRKAKRRVVQVEDTFQYIPLLESLKVSYNYALNISAQREAEYY